MSLDALVMSNRRAWISAEVRLLGTDLKVLKEVPLLGFNNQWATSIATLTRISARLSPGSFRQLK